MVVGIDYGSKFAGTSAVAILESGAVSLKVSQSKKDSDRFIVDLIQEIGYKGHVYIDAPLSLPGVFQNLEGYDDYFYRNADRLLKAMSPMFLGGLTARAIKLKDSLLAEGVILREAYPAAMARELKLYDLGYKKSINNLSTVVKVLEENLMVSLQGIRSWHEIDAILALQIGIRHEKGEGVLVGDEREGQICI